jgi:acyl carrier protein
VDRNTVFLETCEVLADTFDVPAASITEKTKAADVRGWDSLTHLIALTGIEKRFDITLPTAAANAAQDVGALTDLIWCTLEGPVTGD